MDIVEQELQVPMEEDSDDERILIDDMNERRQFIRRMQAVGEVQEKVEGFFEEVVPLMTDQQYKEQFRLSRVTVEKVMRAVGAEEEEEADIPMEKKLLLFLWYLGSVVGIRKVAMLFGLSLGAAWASMDQVVGLLVGLKETHIRFPPKEKLAEVMARFAAKGFPGAIGAVDGCHIRISRPSDNEQAYVNRKHHHSINLMAVADDRSMFLDVCIGWPGSVHDSRVFKNSPLGLRLMSPRFREQALPEDSHLVGDAAFQLSPFMMTPFRDNQIRAGAPGDATPAQKKHFNYKLSGARVVIEHAFGILKGRFRRLGYVETKSVVKANKIIGAACVLHNMCGALDDDWDGEDCVPDGNEVEPEDGHAQVDGAGGVAKRFRIVQELWRVRAQ